MAPDPDLSGCEQAEPPDEVDDPDVDEVDPTGRYFGYVLRRPSAVPSRLLVSAVPSRLLVSVDMLFSLVGLLGWFIAC